jgi:hypothetical protein
VNNKDRRDRAGDMVEYGIILLFLSVFATSVYFLLRAESNHVTNTGGEVHDLSTPTY